ncbi:Insect cuticle protein [Popillia japonica]|uniref:Insect cuticle protein n=1 Tax=Popillia japonica TaxID=7064 RepID=A0AAW1N9X6_POPJA
MYSLIVFACLATLAYSAPAAVEVTQDTVGNYKFIYKTDDATRVEVRHADGHVYGSIKYYDPEGHLRTLEYTSGPEGYHATGPLVPTPVKDTHEVAVARSNHLNVFNAIDRYLPRLNPHGLVDETPEVPLSKEEFLASVSAVLHGGHLAFTADTPEVSHAKIEHYKAVSDALGH